METKIVATDKGIEIDIADVEGKKDELLEAFNECSQGRCTCPTQEYKKIESLEIVEAGDGIQLSITAKEDQEIDTAEIEKCLEHTRQRLSE